MVPAREPFSIELRRPNGRCRVSDGRPVLLDSEKLGLISRETQGHLVAAKLSGPMGAAIGPLEWLPKDGAPTTECP